jgi:hypothetical protein
VVKGIRDDSVVQSAEREACSRKVLSSIPDGCKVLVLACPFRSTFVRIHFCVCEEGSAGAGAV